MWWTWDERGINPQISQGFVWWTWDKHREDATDAGVLDGHVDTSPLDLKESAEFLDALRSQNHGDFFDFLILWLIYNHIRSKIILMCCLRFSGDLVWVDCFVFWGQTREVRQVLFCDLRMLVLCLLYRLVVICLDLQKMKTQFFWVRRCVIGLLS